VKKLLSVKEAAAELGISERACWQRIYRNELPHRRWTSKVVIVASDLEKFIATLPGLSAEEAAAKIEDHAA
jgi:predicted DNA-binding transcriptional regulator AlpA